MVIQKIKKLELARARLASMEAAIAKEMQDELAALPGAYGFSSLKDFSRALATAIDGKGKRRKRAKITDQTRASVKKLVEAGRTGSQIAQELGISRLSVQNIKKALGLVKLRA